MWISVKYDRAVDAWVVHNKGVVLRTPSDVLEWRTKLVAELQKLEGERGFLLIDMQEMEVDISVKDEYGEVEKMLHEKYAREVLRFGESVGFTNTVLLLESAKLQFPANLHPHRGAAERALQHLRLHDGRASLGDNCVKLFP
jgi:hypothetical protein